LLLRLKSSALRSITAMTTNLKSNSSIDSTLLFDIHWKLKVFITRIEFRSFMCLECIDVTLSIFLISEPPRTKPCESFVSIPTQAKPNLSQINKLYKPLNLAKAWLFKIYFFSLHKGQRFF
jgi:hypothetical protein